MTGLKAGAGVVLTAQLQKNEAETGQRGEVVLNAQLVVLTGENTQAPSMSRAAAGIHT